MGDVQALRVGVLHANLGAIASASINGGEELRRVRVWIEESPRHYRHQQESLANSSGDHAGEIIANYPRKNFLAKAGCHIERHV